MNEYPDYAVLTNLFTGQATVIDRSLSEKIKEISTGVSLDVLSESQVKKLKERGFIYDTENEEYELTMRFYEWLVSTMIGPNPSHQYQILLSYNCNLHCVYCFQKSIEKKQVLSIEKLQKIFEIIREKENEYVREAKSTGSKPLAPVISIVGGEPLLPDSAHRELICLIVEFSKQNHYPYSITTNGVNLGEYVSLFQSLGYEAGDIQVTLDGPREIHDKRRIAVNGSGSFDRIMSSLEKAIASDLHISLRINVDNMNVHRLTELADLIIAKGWHLRRNFSAYIAPVTDHSNVNNDYCWINTDSSLLTEIVSQFQKKPYIKSIFNMKGFRGFSYVERILRGTLFPPTYFRCESLLGQLIFDPYGDVFCCFEGSGREDAKIGTFFPDLVILTNKMAEWKELNVMSSKWCIDCKYKFVCAGGCPWKMIHQGVSECLPIEEEINIAWNYYATQIISRIGSRARL